MEARRQGQGRVGSPMGWGPAARTLATSVAVAGPLGVAAIRMRVPYAVTDGPEAMAAAVAADLDAMSWVLWFGLLAMLALVPATILVSMAPLRRSRALTMVGMVLAVAGYASLGMLVAADLLLHGSVAAGLDTATAAQVLNSAHPVADVGVAVFVPAHLLGTILLGVALWRTRTAPRWAAGAVIASQPLHVLSAVVLVSPIADGASWLLLAVGFGAVAWTHLGSTSLAEHVQQPGRGAPVANGHPLVLGPAGDPAHA